MSNEIKIPWVDKWKPNNLDNLIIDDNIKNIIESFNKDTITHLILYGESGIGKTTLSHIIPNRLGIKFKEYNASDTRGINTINELLILYKKINSKLIIILDEADNLTIKAQELIINVMDNYKDIIFIFTCNSYEYLLNDIIIRSIFLNIVCKDMNKYKNYVFDIIKKEQLNINSETIEKLIKEVNFDIRMIINKLELLKILYGKKRIDSFILDKFNTLSCIKECIEIINILFNEKKKLIDFIDIYNDKLNSGLNFIDLLNIFLFIFNNYNLFKDEINKEFSKANIIDFLTLIHKSNIKLLSQYIYTDLQYYNVLIDFYNFSLQMNVSMND